MKGTRKSFITLVMTFFGSIHVGNSVPKAKLIERDIIDTEILNHWKRLGEIIKISNVMYYTSVSRGALTTLIVLNKLKNISIFHTFLQYYTDINGVRSILLM